MTKKRWVSVASAAIGFIGLVFTILSYFGIVPICTSPKTPGTSVAISSYNQSGGVTAQNVTVINHAVSPELMVALERANIERGKQTQIIEELQKKLKETEEALKERHVPEDALAKFKAGKYEEAETLFAKELKEGTEKAASANYYLGNIKLAQ
ncbi:MAG TPA: hypothetical protein ACFYEK_13970, partial [Candidatus Wunengus sp. YC60]|uniref:hypothetical protein n=1 Tax=Candidatus Wunengus sp. YC60 TaxID=3367697 RepID=UPI0040285A91